MATSVRADQPGAAREVDWNVIRRRIVGLRGLQEQRVQRSLHSNSYDREAADLRDLFDDILDFADRLAERVHG